MKVRARHIGRVLVTAVAVALLLSALPASVATAGPPDACRVMNFDTGVVRKSLQRAVSAASSGDHLGVQGKCKGSAVVDKDLHIKGVRIASSSVTCDRSGKCRDAGTRDSGRPVLKSGRSRPTIVVDPSVTAFTIAKGLTVRGGLVIGDPDEWPAAVASTPAIATTFPSPASTAAAGLSPTACRVVNIETGAEFGDLGTAVQAASTADDLTLQGTCAGRTYIDKALTVTGVRGGGSSYTCDKAGKCTGPVRDASGAPTIRSSASGSAIVVAPGASDITFKQLRIRGGLRIKDIAP